MRCHRQHGRQAPQVISCQAHPSRQPTAVRCVHQANNSLTTWRSPMASGVSPQQLPRCSTGCPQQVQMLASCRHLTPRRTAASATSKAAGGISSLTHFGFATNFDERFEIEEYLGSGSFGSVYTCTERSTGNRYAVKTIPKKRFGQFLEQNFVRRIQHEVDMFKHMGRSLNVAYLHSVFEDEQCVDMVMQLCTGGELWKRIRRGAYSEKEAAKLIREVLRAVAQCHSRGVVFRDVKPENFLFLDDSPDSPLKMIDFGIAEYCDENQELHDRAGSPVYCAPEVLRRSYGLKADVWSAGVIAYELLAARLPFVSEDGFPLAPDLKFSQANLSNKDIFAAILYADLDFQSPPWDVVSEQARDFVQKLLTRDPAHRPSAAEALQHPWLAGIDQATSSMDGGVSNGSSHGSKEPLWDDSLVQKLQRYGTYNRLKQVGLSKVASQMLASYSPQALADLQAVLGSVAVQPPATDHSNGSSAAPPKLKIPYHKMVEVLNSGRWQLSPVEVRQLLSCFTIDSDGCMDASEWLAALTDWKDVQQSEAWEKLVDRAFSAIDRDGSGRLDVPELESLLCGEDQACPIDDTVPAALREAQAATLNTMDEARDNATTPTAPSAGTQTSQQASAKQPSSQSPWAAGTGGKKTEREFVFDRTAFARLLRMRQQDRLELFEDRQARRREARSRSPSMVPNRQAVEENNQLN